MNIKNPTAGEIVQKLRVIRKRISFADCGIIHENGLTFPNQAQIPVLLHYKNGTHGAANV